MPASLRLLVRSLGVIAVAGVLPSSASADWFGSGDNRFEIPFVTVGDPGNPADTVTPNEFSAPLPSGVVDYNYRIAKYEISEEIVAKANALSDASGDSLGLTVDVERGPQKPATGLSWFDAARFVNFLNAERGSPPAYKFAEDDRGRLLFQLWEPTDPSYDPNNLFRNTRAYYFLPSADEWHKAAYYDTANDRYWLYPHGADMPPTPVASGTDPGTAVYNQDGPADVQLAGGENVNGVVGMAGNVADFEETTRDLLNADASANRGVNGGWWSPLLPVNFASSFRNSGLAGANQPLVGIRIASVPEPNSCALSIVALLACGSLGNRKLTVSRRSKARLLCLAILMGAFAAGARADQVLYQSATLDNLGTSSGEVNAASLSEFVFTGVRFELDQPVVTTAIGGHFVGSGSFFGALVALDGEDDVPDSGDLSTPDVLGVVTAEFPEPSAEVFADLSLTLQPGWYAIAYGSGLFGAAGSGGMPVSLAGIDERNYLGGQQNAWFELPPGFFEVRFVLKGYIVPEPSCMQILLGLTCMAFTRCRNAS